MSNWTPEDDKLATLAKGARSRVQASSGAALRDETGRTYASAKISVGHLDLSAIEIVIAQAAASGSTGIESVVVCATDNPGFSSSDIELIRTFAGTGVPLYQVNDAGDISDSQIT
jgi:hypothetical protein